MIPVQNLTANSIHKILPGNYFKDLALRFIETKPKDGVNILSWPKLSTRSLM